MIKVKNKKSEVEVIEARGRIGGFVSIALAIMIPREKTKAEAVSG